MLTQASPRENLTDRAQAKRLVLFDFDGTITTSDTLAGIVMYYHGKWKYRRGLVALSPVLALYAVKAIPNYSAKQKLISWFFKGEDALAFDRRCREFALKIIPSIVRPAALEALRRHRDSGATVAVVTASAENWVKPWCDMHGVLCLGTRLEVSDGRLTGRFLGRNCHGSEKVCRIKEHFRLEDFGDIVAYGDSRGDHEMLDLAHEKHYRPFRDDPALLRRGLE